MAKKSKVKKEPKRRSSKSAKASTGKRKALKAKSSSKRQGPKKGSKGSKASKVTKTSKPRMAKHQDPKGKRVSALDAAAKVLAKAGKPMRSRELITAMAEQGLWTSPGGKTPWATLHAAMMREISTAGKDSRFNKVDRGAFAYNG